MRHHEQTLIEKYLEELVPALNPFEQSARNSSQEIGLAGISLSRGEAAVLRWIVGCKPVKKAVEIGTLTGLSGLYILDGISAGGQLWTLEKSQQHADLARPVLEQFATEVSKKVEVIVGDARENLPRLQDKGPFDFIFIDGNKAAYGDYLKWAEDNLVSGGLLAADNVFLSGAVAGASGTNFSDKQIAVMRKFNERLMDSKFWRGVLLPTTEGLFLAERV